MDFESLNKKQCTTSVSLTQMHAQSFSYPSSQIEEISLPLNFQGQIVSTDLSPSHRTKTTIKIKGLSTPALSQELI